VVEVGVRELTVGEGDVKRTRLMEEADYREKFTQG